MLSLTHNLILFTANRRAGNAHPKDMYIVLGDDSVIRSKSVSENYLKIIKDLKMEISELKSLESEDSFEFAKRFISRGQDFSPLPLGQLKHAGTQYWEIAGFIEQLEDREFSWVPRAILVKRISQWAFPRSRSRSIIRKINRYLAAPNPFRDNWEEDLRYNLGRFMNPEKVNFGCSTPTSFLQQYILELVIHVTMNYIHEVVVKSVKNFNKFAQSEEFQDYKLSSGTVHPIVEILHGCASSLRELEYSNSSDPIEETDKYFKMKVSLKDYLTIPENIASVTNTTGYSKTLRARVFLNHRLSDVIELMDHNRQDALSKSDEDLGLAA
jgi:hypothetical protein